MSNALWLALFVFYLEIRFMSFQIDLARGKGWEDELLAACAKKFPVAQSEVSQQLKHGGDFYTHLGDSLTAFYVECKHDYAAKRTGNLYLELTVSYPDKAPIPGWTAKLPKYCVIVWKVDDGEYYAMNELEIKEWLAKDLKVVSFNKKVPYSTGALLPVKQLTRLNSLEEVVQIICENMEAIIAIEESVVW